MTMTKLEQMQVAYDKLLEAAKALEAIDHVHAEMLAEAVTGHAGLIDVLMTEAGETA
jgi:hypothetical protein